jgi:hypothetical protein
MIGPVRAFADGARRTLGALRIVTWVWLANLLFALPMAAVVGDAIGDSIGGSRVGESLLEGFDLVWHSEYAEKSQGVAGTLAPSQVGVGAFLDNLELWFSGELFGLEPGLVAAGLLYALLWALLAGGVLAHVQSRERATLGSFFSFGGEFFFRFVRLALVLAVAYYLVYRFSHWLFGRVEIWTRETTVEKSVLLYNLLAAALVLLLLAGVRMVADYAKIAIVLEDRRSSLLAALRGARFVLRRPLRTFGLMLLVAAIGAGLLLLYSVASPGVGQASWTAVLVAFLVSQLFLFARLGLRVALLAAELELYESAAPFPSFDPEV